MNLEAEILMLAFSALGGLIMMLPVILMGMITITGILKMIGGFLLIIIFSVLFYIITTDATLMEILTLEVKSIILPNRILGVSYIILTTFTIALPIAIIRKLVNDKKT